jgi:hypothetical protein
MTANEAKERLCALVAEVGQNKFNHQYPCDCFCGQNKYGEKIHDKVVEFIEKAVRDAMNVVVEEAKL